MGNGFFTPPASNLADCMPFYYNGEFFIFYLKSLHCNTSEKPGVPWALVRTKNLFDFNDEGIILQNSSKDNQEYFLYTGWVLKHDGLFHMFYEAHNPTFPELGRARQGIRHATSTDLYHWEKHPEDDFFSPGGKYERDDWRDPMVFWNEDDRCFWMVFSAKHSYGMPKGRGFVALAKSDDLSHWSMAAPLYKPERYEVLECPDLFKMGDWWYLLFSEYNDEFMTRYRMSKSPTGPWIEPKIDRIDGRAFYAARTYSVEGSRFIFGWIPARKGNSPLGSWEFGGTLVIHELFQRADGTLGVKAPETHKGFYHNRIPVSLINSIGTVHTENNRLLLKSSAAFSCVCMGELPPAGYLSFDYEVFNDSSRFGLWLFGSEDFEEGYYLRIDSPEKRLCLDLWPRNHETGILDRDVNPFIPGLYQRISDEASKHGHVDFFYNQTVGTAYIQDGSALSVRMYHSDSNKKWGFFSRNSNVIISNYTLMTV